jgi:hypothetical protein
LGVIYEKEFSSITGNIYRFDFDNSFIWMCRMEPSQSGTEVWATGKERDS